MNEMQRRGLDSDDSSSDNDPKFNNDDAASDIYAVQGKIMVRLR